MQARFIVVYRGCGLADNLTMIPRYFIQCCRLLPIILLYTNLAVEKVISRAVYDRATAKVQRHPYNIITHAISIIL